MKGWVGLVGWPIADGYPHKWSPVSCRSSMGQGKFGSQRPTFYHCATQPTLLGLAFCLYKTRSPNSFGGHSRHEGCGIPSLKSQLVVQEKERKSIYIVPFIYYVYLKELRHGSHSFTCKYTRIRPRIILPCWSQCSSSLQCLWTLLVW